MSESGGAAIPADLEAIRQENERLKREIEKTAPERREKRLRLRRILVGILVVLTCLSLVVTTVGVWAHRTVFDTDTFVSTVGPVIEQPQVTARLANYLTDQIVTGLDLQQRASDVLTQIAPQAAFLAGPITNGIEGFVHDKILTFVRSDTFKNLWYGTLRTAHDAAVKVLEGHSGEVLTIANGEVTLNFVPLVISILQQVQQAAQGLLGDRITLPDVTSNLTPQQLISALSTALGKPLPPDFGQVTVFKSDQLAAAQDAVDLFNKAIWAMVIVSLILIAATLLLSVNRRRTLVQLALGTIVAMLVARLAIRGISKGVVNSIASADGKGTARAALNDLFQSLRGFTRWLLVIALIVFIVAFLAGKREWLQAARGQAAKAFGAGKDLALSDRPAARWIEAHLEAFEAGGAIVALLLLFWIGLGWASVITIGALLVLYELGLRWLAAKRTGPGEPGPAAA